MDEDVQETSSFDPKGHLTLVSGQPYMEVKWRLVWLREEHPEAVIETEMLWHDRDEYAIFRATIFLPGSGASATGHGMEDKGGFGDYLEKAETKAIGRALGALGYGTQFASDFAEVGQGPRARGAPNGQVSGRPDDGYVPDDISDNEQWVADAISDGQGKAIWAICKNRFGENDEATAKRFMADQWGITDKNKLTKRQASAVIEHLNRIAHITANTP